MLRFVGWKIEHPCHFVLAQPQGFAETLLRHYPLAGMTPGMITGVNIWSGVSKWQVAVGHSAASQGSLTGTVCERPTPCFVFLEDVRETRGGNPQTPAGGWSH